ncbi:MAG TPA: universal stress protein, partial [Lautropia sp.]|nr:universal stress protein [Lautropia sp.]
MKILAPVDGSKASLKAIKHACNMLASAPQFSVTLMSVHDDIALKHARSIVGSKAVDGYLQELSDKDLASARKLLDKAGVKHEVLIRTGHIAQEI